MSSYGLTKPPTPEALQAKAREYVTSKDEVVKGSFSCYWREEDLAFATETYGFETTVYAVVDHVHERIARRSTGGEWNAIEWGCMPSATGTMKIFARTNCRPIDHVKPGRLSLEAWGIVRIPDPQILPGD